MRPATSRSAGRPRRPAAGAGTGMRLVIATLAAVTLASGCARTAPKDSPGVQSGPEAQLAQAVELLKLGERARAGETFARLLEPGQPETIRPQAYFFLGVVRLLEMEDLTRVREAREHFDSYPVLFPRGPWLENARAISLGLERILRQAEADRKEILDLRRQAERQQARTRALEQKILQLERIYLETEEKRQSVAPPE